ncbi:MAG: lytic transglycosylase domain-containing protein [Longimicrobiales bacterium]
MIKPDRTDGSGTADENAELPSHTEPDETAPEILPAEEAQGGFLRSLSGHGTALKIGLAASSLALVAGRTVTQGSQDPNAAHPSDPAGERDEVKQVSWDLERRPAAENDRVEFFTEFLMGRNYDKTHQWLERVGKYGPMIQNELRERGMPEDLLYLAMIESGLSPQATSTAKAAGMWQFIQETGERYGLEVNEYVDERRDPVEATAAALTYLQKMHNRFGSWYLSAAGYNTGENRVGRLMREQTGSEKAQSEDLYWEIWESLPRETRDYVPLMLAMGTIAKEPGKYGFNDLKVQAPLQYEEVTVPGGTKLSDVAIGAGVSAEEVNDLNPHLIKKMTPPGGSYKVRVPVGRSDQVIAAISGMTGGDLSRASVDVTAAE